MLYGVLSMGFTTEVSINETFPEEKVIGTTIVVYPLALFRVLGVTVPLTVIVQLTF
jgi:hypothetical protein